jgi:hypothetical protein
MGVNKDLATMARKKMCVCFLWWWWKDAHIIL